MAENCIFRLCLEHDPLPKDTALPPLAADEATVYLTGIASEHMGLSVVDADAAAATAHAIGDYLVSLPDGPKTVR